MKVIKIIVFILIFVILFLKINNILKIKTTGIDSLSKFAIEDVDTIDVLLLGTSHSFVNINSTYLFKEYGIAAYNLAGGGQALWNTYFYFKEALKTQKPKLIILEVYQTIRTKYYLYNNANNIVENNYGLKSYIDRINGIKMTSSKEKWNDFFNPLYQYHNRYSSLSLPDFISPYSYDNKYIYSKGSVMLYSYTNTMNIFKDLTSITNRRELYSESEKYYRMIIELAKKNNMDMLIIKAPYSNLPTEYQEVFNKSKDIADEYNIPFINLNLNPQEYDLDFTNDFRDDSHLNYIGAMKVAKYVGKYLKDNYDLPDRRGDPKYYSWEMNVKYYYREVFNFELKQISNFNEYIEKIKNTDDYITAITMLGSYEKDDIIIKNIISNFNINNVYLQNSSYVLDDNKVIYSSSGSNEYLFHKEIGNYTDLVVDSGKKLSINRTNYIKTTNGINMIIYDKFTGAIADNLYLEYDNNHISDIISR